MTTTFPTTLDTFFDPDSLPPGQYAWLDGTIRDAPTDPANILSTQAALLHTTEHGHVNDALLAAQTKIGIDGSLDTASLDYKVAQRVLGSGTTGTLAQWTTAGTIGDATNTDAQVSAAVTASHAAVTLDVNAATILDLSTQALGLDTQAANTVWRGPTTGAPAVPTFGALVAADIPAHNQNASTIIIPTGMGTPTYDDTQDFLNMTQASGRLTGGVLSAHAGPNGTLDISEMEGMIHTSTVLGSPLIYFKKAAVASITLTDLAVNYIWITYTAPLGVPTLTYSANPARPTDDYNVFVVGRVWRSGNTVEVVNSGQNIYNQYGRAQDRMLTKYGAMDHATGAVLSAHATALKLDITAGVWYFGNTRIDTGAKTVFHVWYRTGGSATWVESASISLFSEVFDGVGGNKVYETYQNGTSLAAIVGTGYGVYWMFVCPEGDLYAVLGTASYANIGLAQAAKVPGNADLPPYMVNWARLVGRVICRKSAPTGALYSVESSFATQFTLSAATDHASLANLPWTDSAHTGTANRLAAFGATGAATLLEMPNQRILSANLALVNGQCLTFINYLNIGTYTLTLAGDSAVRIF